MKELTVTRNNCYQYVVEKKEIPDTVEKLKWLVAHDLPEKLPSSLKYLLCRKVTKLPDNLPDSIVLIIADEVKFLPEKLPNKLVHLSCVSAKFIPATVKKLHYLTVGLKTIVPNTIALPHDQPYRCI